MTNFNFDEGQLLQNLEAFKIFETKGQSMAKMLMPFISQMELSFLDYLTIRDLMELGGCQGDTALAIVLMAMFSALQEGSLCLDLDQDKFINRLPADTRKKAAKTFDNFLSGLNEGKYQKLITKNGDEYMPLILYEFRERQLLYFQKYYLHERQLKKRMEALLNAEVSYNIPEQEIENLLEEIYSTPLAIRVGPDNTPITRDLHQIKAIRLALNVPIFNHFRWTGNRQNFSHGQYPPMSCPCRRPYVSNYFWCAHRTGSPKNDRNGSKQYCNYTGTFCRRFGSSKPEREHFT